MERYPRIRDDFVLLNLFERTSLVQFRRCHIVLNISTSQYVNHLRPFEINTLENEYRTLDEPRNKKPHNSSVLLNQVYKDCKNIITGST